MLNVPSKVFEGLDTGKHPILIRPNMEVLSRIKKDEQISVRTPGHQIVMTVRDVRTYSSLKEMLANENAKNIYIKKARNDSLLQSLQKKFGTSEQFGILVLHLTH